MKKASAALIASVRSAQLAALIVKYIQRVDTIGGVAPSAGCDAAHAGAEARVGYSANYDFYGVR